MDKKKKILVCNECLSRNYTTYSSRETKPIEIKKHCKVCNAHTVHKETR